jgi:hypothetical protein
MMIGDSGQGNQLLVEHFNSEDAVVQSEHQGKQFYFNMLPVDQTTESYGCSSNRDSAAPLGSDAQAGNASCSTILPCHSLGAPGDELSTSLAQARHQGKQFQHSYDV